MMTNRKKIIITESQYKRLLFEQKNTVKITDNVLSNVFQDDDEKLFNKFLNKRNYSEIKFPFDDYEIVTPNISKLPDNMIFEGNLLINLPNLEKLPENLTINGNLHVSAPKVTELPESLTVDGYLIIIDTGIVLDAEQTNSVKENIGSEGIFSKNNLKVAIEIDLIDSKDYLDVGRDYSDEIFNRIFDDDYFEWFSGYDGFDLKSTMDYYVDRNNESKIEEIVQKYIETNNMFEETEDMDLTEKIDYLDLDEIKNALAVAESDAMNEAYHSWLIKEVISAYDDYGTVEELSWDKIKLTVDLSDYILSMDEYDFNNYLNNCSVDLECWFNEMKGNEIDMPRFSPDDRYTVLPDKKDFNQILSDRLLEIEY
jgi:hypothetical protein